VARTTLEIVQRSHKGLGEHLLGFGVRLDDDERVSTRQERVVLGPDTVGWLLTVARDVEMLDRSSTAERVAGVLRRRITEGDMPPRTHLSEEQLIEVLHVSRNTLREAFRLLTHEGLLVHRLHRGVFVRELGEEDLVDLYRLRRLIECNVVRGLEEVRPEPDLLRRLAEDVEEGESASRRGDWGSVGTANMKFHRHLVALARSPRTDQVTDRLLAELRLAFHAAASPQRLHEPYVGRNRALLERLSAGDYALAADELEAYLEDSLAELLDAVRSRESDGSVAPGGAESLEVTA
jgi:DNA-binding GntR family transcriptional regulator